MVGRSAINCSGGSAISPDVPVSLECPRKMKWAVAVKMRTMKGALWMPGVGARLCQDHFVTGKYLQNYPRVRSLQETT